MSDDRSARLALPLLQTGQAQKEITHNEALALLDVATAASVVAAGVDTPPATPAIGECWIVGDAPAGAWSGRARALAGWTSGGWRFVMARAGMTVWDEASGSFQLFHDGAWEAGMVRGARLVVGGVQVVGAQQSAVAAPTGGATVDAEARTTISAILLALRGHGLIAA